MPKPRTLPEWAKVGAEPIIEGSHYSDRTFTRAKIVRVTDATVYVQVPSQNNLERQFRYPVRENFGKERQLEEWGGSAARISNLLPPDSPAPQEWERKKGRRERWQKVQEKQPAFYAPPETMADLQAWEIYAHALVEYLGKERGLRALEAGQE